MRIFNYEGGLYRSLASFIRKVWLYQHSSQMNIHIYTLLKQSNLPARFTIYQSIIYYKFCNKSSFAECAVIALILRLWCKLCVCFCGCARCDRRTSSRWAGGATYNASTRLGVYTSSFLGFHLSFSTSFLIHLPSHPALSYKLTLLTF